MDLVFDDSVLVCLDENNNKVAPEELSDIVLLRVYDLSWAEFFIVVGLKAFHIFMVVLLFTFIETN